MKRVLDVATGTGAQAFAFAARAREVVGVDLSKAMLRVAQRKNRFANLQQADATHLPFANASFDVSCVSFCLHEMPSSVRRGVVREMARVTRDGGTIIIVDYGLPRNPSARWLVYHVVKAYEPEHYTHFIRSNLDLLLERAGIEPLKSCLKFAGLAQITLGRKCSKVQQRAT